jgi:hypothetical protein
MSMRLYSTKEALEVLKRHGIKDGNVQTATFEGKLVLSGHSFFELCGYQDFYTQKEVFNFLGY